MHIAALPARRDDQGGEAPTGSTLSTDSSAEWSTHDPRAESGNGSSSSSPRSDSEHCVEKRQEVEDEQEKKRADHKTRELRVDPDAM